jgi:hypothetical protein
MLRPLLFASLLASFSTSGLSAAEPPADPPEGQDVKVQLTVPDSSWSLRISQVYEVGDELWVVAQVQRKQGFGLQVISKVKDAVKVPGAKERPVKVFILGKKWGWENKEKYEFPKDRKKLDEQLKEKEARLILERPKQKDGEKPARPFPRPLPKPIR